MSVGQDGLGVCHCACKCISGGVAVVGCGHDDRGDGNYGNDFDGGNGSDDGGDGDSDRDCDDGR